MTATQNAIHRDIALFLGDAGSEHQAFSIRVLRDYLVAEGHAERHIIDALNDWAPCRVSNSRGDDEFYLDGKAWEKVEGLRRHFFGRVSGGRSVDTHTIFQTLTRWAVARLGQENLS